LHGLIENIELKGSVMKNNKLLSTGFDMESKNEKITNKDAKVIDHIPAPDEKLLRYLLDRLNSHK
jgi:hypothetical protein